MLQAVDATFGYGDTPVLHGVSLEIPAGALVGLIGPNGAGKTTLLRLLAGTRRPSRGQVLLDGSPLTNRSRTAIAQRIAVVPQDSQLAFDYTALEVVLMGRYAHLGTFSVEGPADLALAVPPTDRARHPDPEGPAPRRRLRQGHLSQEEHH